MKEAVVHTTGNHYGKSRVWITDLEGNVLGNRHNPLYYADWNLKTGSTEGFANDTNEWFRSYRHEYRQVASVDHRSGTILFQPDGNYLEFGQEDDPLALIRDADRESQKGYCARISQVKESK